MASAILLVLGLLTSGHALFFLWWEPQKVSELSPAVVWPTYVGPGGKRTLETHRRRDKRGVCLEPSPRLGLFSERRKRAVQPVPDVGARGVSPGKGAWPSRSGGVAVHTEQRLQGEQEPTAQDGPCP